MASSSEMTISTILENFLCSFGIAPERLMSRSAAIGLFLEWLTVIGDSVLQSKLVLSSAISCGAR